MDNVASWLQADLPARLSNFRFALGSGHSLLAWLDPNLRARVGAVDGIRDMLLANEVMYSV
jgi:hypothetical protein